MFIVHFRFHVCIYQTRCCADNGGLCPIFERPEQGLDMLQEAITSLGLKPGKDFYLAINCAAHEMWDNVRALTFNRSS